MTTNGGDVQIDIDLARTTTNGGEIAAQPFTRVAVNTQTPENATGDTVVGNFELRFTSIAPFSFPGGGLIIRFSNPSPSYAADPAGGGNITGASSTDPSGFFVRRAFSDPDGVAPWNGDFVFIGGFRVTTAEAPPEAGRCQGKQVTISGSDDAETLRGTQHADVIKALGGKDKVIARAGNDVVCGGAGKDNISGGAGKDKMNGEAGKDLLRGGKGKDTAKGGPGRDTLKGGQGRDTLKGGPGRDTLIGGPKHDVCIGGSGRDISKSC
jgi:Ca2+-binding RTX toxin-like protein